MTIDTESRATGSKPHSRSSSFTSRIVFTKPFVSPIEIPKEGTEEKPYVLARASAREETKQAEEEAKEEGHIVAAEEQQERPYTTLQSSTKGRE